MNKLIVSNVDHHRNGVTGEPFHVLTFHEAGKDIGMVAVVFDAPGHVAVFDRKLLGEGEIRFSYNSWCGDVFEDKLRKIVAGYDDGYRA